MRPTWMLVTSAQNDATAQAPSCTPRPSSGSCKGPVVMPSPIQGSSTNCRRARSWSAGYGTTIPAAMRTPAGTVPSDRAASERIGEGVISIQMLQPSGGLDVHDCAEGVLVTFKTFDSPFANPADELRGWTIREVLV